MTLLVRNEEDIVRYNIDFHLSRGVDFIIATDNASTDGTREVLKEFEKKGVLLLMDEKEHNYAQAKWVNRMGKIAYEKYKADFIFHCDADEFWFPRSGSLKHEISKGTADILNVNVINILLEDKGGIERFPQDSKYAVVNPTPTNDYKKETAGQNLYFFKYPTKVLFSTKNKFLEVSEGNHAITNKNGTITENTSQDIIIYHYPIRNKEHFYRKVILGGKAFSQNETLANTMGIQIWRWYDSYQKGLLNEEYKKLLLDKDKANQLMLEGFIEKSNFNALILDHNASNNRWEFFHRRLEYKEVFGYFDTNGYEHQCFFYDLVRNVRPSRIIELGVCEGHSFFAFCQAVKDGNLDTEFFVVDTCEDNNDNEFRGIPFWNTFNRIKKTFYEYLPIRLLKKTSDEAVCDFETKSIDILHINGYHSYESLKTSLNRWYGKVKENGVILFHYITEANDKFENYQFWREASKDYTTFEFHHSHGLGVLYKGDSLFEGIVDYQPVLRRCYEMAEYNRQLINRLTANKRIIESQRDRITSLSQTNVNQHMRINTIMTSLSWIMTSPFRFILTLLKSLGKISVILLQNMLNLGKFFRHKIARSGVSKTDGDKNHTYEYEFDPSGDNAPSKVIRMVGKNKRVLEIGAGPGSITRILKQNNNCRITGVDIDPSAIEKLSEFCEVVYQCDLNTPEWISKLSHTGTFDVIVAADVLEHLNAPKETLASLKPFLSSDGYIVISIPHIGNNAIIASIFNSDFEYRDSGLLDKTHIHFFGIKNMQDLVEASGYTILEAEFVIIPPEMTELASHWRKLSKSIKSELKHNPYGSVYQVVMKVAPSAYQQNNINLLDIIVPKPNLTRMESFKSWLKHYLHTAR